MPRAGSDGGGRDTAGASSPVPTAGQVWDTSRYDVAGHRIGIAVRGGHCFVADVPAPGGTERLLALGLRAPCYLLTWPGPAPSGETSDGAVPVGSKADAMAWRYGGTAGPTVLIAIGDPPSEAQWAKRPKLRNARCAVRYRGVRLRGAATDLSGHTAQGFICVESGRDEKDFWLFAHEK
jgi:hypothetical protein